jgi:hypothetical protein
MTSLPSTADVDRLPTVFFFGSSLTAECDIVIDLEAVDCGIQEFKFVQNAAADVFGSMLSSFKTVLIC